MPETYIVQGLATAMQEQAALVIFNNEAATSLRTYTVRGVEVRPSSPNPSATVPGSTNFRRISACSSGSGDDVTPYPHNLGASAVPSQVLIKTNCLVTATSHQPYRRLVSGTTLGIATGNSYLGNGSTLVGPVDSGSEWRVGSGSVAGIVLAEGEGLACVESAMESQYTWGIQIVFTIGSSTYSAMMYANASNGGEASWAIFNGSGSGVTITVNGILAADQGTSNTTQAAVDMPYIRYCRIHGYDGGETVPLVPLNAGNTPPASLIAKKNRLQAILTVSSYESGGLSFSDLGYPNATAGNTVLVRKWGTFGHRSPYQGSIGGPNVAMANGNLMFPAPGFGPSMGIDMESSQVSGIVLRPQEGFAVLSGNISGFANYYFRARVVHNAPAVSGTYSRARVANA